MVQLGLTVAAAAGFALLLVIAARRHLRERQPGALALAQMLAVYGAAALGSIPQVLPEAPVELEQGSGVLLAIAFAFIPLLMVRFAEAFEPVSRTVWRVLLVVWVPMAIGAMLWVGGLFSVPVAGAFLVAFLLLWACGHGVAVAWLLRGGRGAVAVVARRRSQLMAAAVGGLGALLPLALVTSEGFGGQTAMTAILAFAVVTVGLLLLGFAPPAVIRWHWARHDRHQLERAQRRMIEIDDPEQLAAELLPHVMRQAGGSAAWLLASDEVVAAVPAGTEPPWRPPAPAAADDPSGGTSRVQTASEGSVLVVPTMRGLLIVKVDPYALLFGARDLDALGALAVGLDVALDRTRLKERELQAVRETEEARRVAEVERVRDDVLATISHEMRTPLTTVCGATAVLAQRWHDLDDGLRHRMVTRAAANADDLRAAVEQVLELTARRLAVVARPDPRRVRVAALLDKTVAGLREVLAGHPVRVTSPEGAVASLDVGATEQMLRHLLVNAVKFSPPDSPVELAALAEGRDLHLTVRDRGPGMSAEDLERAFEPFYRAGDVLRRETRGLGLGLAVVAAVARTLGVRLEADSSPGEGTAVTLVLPDAVAPATQRVGA